MEVSRSAKINRNLSDFRGLRMMQKVHFFPCFYLIGISLSKVCNVMETGVFEFNISLRKQDQFPF